MKTNLSNINKEFFFVYEKTISGHTVFLVFPRANAEWTLENLIYRSSVWDAEGNLISASFKKFFNWEEQPLINPKPFEISNCQLLEKIDGSTLIISNFKNNLITRTRGSIDVSNCENSHEVDFFKNKYPKAFIVSENLSYIYEWVSPLNRIILDYKEPELYLTAVINHSDYSMWSQSDLDKLSNEINVKRPKVYNFKSIEELISTTKEFKGIEGICVYYNHGQNIRKLKSAHYLLLHHFKFNLTQENTLDLFLKYNCPKYNDFLKKISDETDWECAQFISSLASKICDASREVNLIIDAMKKFADSVRPISRKLAAEKILAAYGKTSRSGFVFNFLDNKEINVDGLKKLYLQVLKN